MPAVPAAAQQVRVTTVVTTGLAQDGGPMTNRDVVRLEQLEAQAHVAGGEQVEPRRLAPLVGGPALEPVANGTGADADGD